MTPNVPEIYEGALAATILAHAPLAELPRVRTWQAVDADGRWSPADDMVLPLVVIVGTPPSSEDGRTFVVSLGVACVTNAAEDRDHRSISALYAAVQSVLDALHRQTVNADGAELTTFRAHIAERMAGAAYTLHIGGITLESPAPPTNESGRLIVGMEIAVHYSRSDT